MQDPLLKPGGGGRAAEQVASNKSCPAVRNLCSAIGAIGSNTGVSPQVYFSVLTACVVLLVADNVLCYILLQYYTEVYAQYINQATGTVYGIVTIPVLLIRRHYRRKNARPSSHSPPTPNQITVLEHIQHPKDRESDNESERMTCKVYATLVLIGVLNGTGNFMFSVGDINTRSETQSLLALIGIPVVIVLTSVLYQKCPSPIAVVSAVLITGGICVSSLPSILHPAKGKNNVWYGVILVLAANVFLGLEKVVEERIFAKTKVDVLLMFFFTVWTQVILGWGYYPLQGVSKAFGGIDIKEIPSIVWDGSKCTFGISSERLNCDWHYPFFFFVYCFVDYMSYTSGLLVIQMCGATIMVLATAIALPVCNMVYALPIMGHFQEQFQLTDLFSLLLVLVGFALFQIYSPEGRKHLESPS